MARKTRPRPLVKQQGHPAEGPPADDGVGGQLPPVAIVGIGASAGGIEAFTALLAAMPTTTGLALVFIQHLAPTRVSMLAEILGRATSIPVTEVSDEPIILPDHVYVVPPDRLMIVKAGALHLAEAQGMQHRGVDRFFTSLAEDQGQRSIGVILSGTATDGTLGLKAIKAAGGITFAQDESAQHDGMPRSAISSGCVDFVLPPAQIATEIVAISTHFTGAAPERTVDPEDFDEVLSVLRKESGIDFSQYKSNTLHRRIRRRMAMHRIGTLSGYADHMRGNAKEIEALYQDILIGVTSFFRDPEAFEVLREKVFPSLFSNRSRHDVVRIWVLGCATGEEAYSLAIALKEYATAINSSAGLSVYATDLNNNAVEKSRAGFYPQTISMDLSRERLRRFFIEADGGYRISKTIRDIVVFARHNVLSDPPFSRMDMISCRNMLIYLEPVLQRKLMPLLHYALKPGGYLFLGSSESLGAQRDLFDVEDGKYKIFSKMSAAPRSSVAMPPLSSAPRGEGSYKHRQLETRTDMTGDEHRDAERALLSRYVPPGVLVNQDMEILQIRGETGHVLTPAPGKASLNVLKMAREGLLIPLRAALQEAIKTQQVVSRDEVSVQGYGQQVGIRLTVIPVPPGEQLNSYWVVFEPRLEMPTPPALPDPAASSRRKGAVSVDVRERDAQISKLTRELAATREYLQSVIEQQEAANEELQSANEEVQSANEELQSINEELETSKEEIQSSNEELTTVNDELQNRNEELNRVNNDLNNLFGSIEMAIVMVWRDLRIRRFTPLAEKIFSLIAGDIGRPISDIKLKVDAGDLIQILTDVIDSVTTRELEVRDARGHWYHLRVRPYKTFENQIDGAIILVMDIDALKRNQEAIAQQAQLLEHTSDAVFVHDADTVVRYWNRSAEQLYGIARASALGRKVQQLIKVDPAQAAAAVKVLADGDTWRGEMAVHKADGSTVIVSMTQVPFAQGDRRLTLETHHDVTRQKLLEETLGQRLQDLAAADKARNDLLFLLGNRLRSPLMPLHDAVRVLQDQAHDSEAAAQARKLIDAEVSRMVRMVDDLVDAAELSHGRVKLQLQPVALQSVLTKAVTATQAMIASRDHRLTILSPPSPIMVAADADRLEQVFIKLLGNAARYTERGGEITVTLIHTAADSPAGSSEAVLSVRDNGVGIDADALTRIFDLFVQPEQPTTDPRSGLGIGLNIVRRIVELHGGQISAHSGGLRAGSEFVVRLPVPHT